MAAPTQQETTTPSAVPGDRVTLGETADTVYGAYRLIAAWSVLLLVMFLLAQTRLGQVVIYYLLILMIFLLLVVNYHTFAAILQPITNPTGAKNG